MKHVEKYQRNYFLPPVNEMKWAKIDHIDRAPVWCSVDLRDGNQSLIVPMSLEEKLDFFTYLCKIGFKEIEIGFPAASETEYAFTRALIERNLIPEDVTVQVLTQSREHIIRKTFEALEGCRRAVVHLYNSTSVAQREQVFRKSKEQIIDIAVSGAKLCAQYKKKASGKILFEYSPESFTGTEMEFALDICNQVLDVWQPDAENPVIINLPATVSVSMPHVYASQIEYMSDHLKYREHVIVSLHPHNDRGCGVADAEMGILAGADRIEGTLFGNGERTGNVDIVTLALNMYSQGVDPKLNLDNLPEVVAEYEKVTRMKVYDRQPYAGQLVFAAFSGSHQDAIAKGMAYRAEHEDQPWTVPYLCIDPKDVGREYDGDVIRINSQSGKGGIGYLLEQKYGFHLPPKMREAFGYAVKHVSDVHHKELSAEEVYQIFCDQYVNIEQPLCAPEYHFRQEEGITTDVTVQFRGKISVVSAAGYGRLDAVCNALRKIVDFPFTLESYTEHALDGKSNSRAAAYVGIQKGEEMFWGAGVHTDIIAASVSALISAINRALA